jgi:DNA polymerase III subunit gamma/tau
VFGDSAPPAPLGRPSPGTPKPIAGPSTSPGIGASAPPAAAEAREAATPAPSESKSPLNAAPDVLPDYAGVLGAGVFGDPAPPPPLKTEPAKESPLSPSAAAAEIVPSPELESPVLAEVPAGDLEQAREAVVIALDSGGHNTAAALLSAGNWSVDADGGIQVVVGIKKTMLSLTMNGEAWKIARDALRSVGATQKMTVMPGEAATSRPAAAVQPARGSVQAAALENPLVRQAVELFRAEVRSVLDLRETSQENSPDRR